MNVGAADDLLGKARAAVRSCQRAGRVPMKWIMGRSTYDRHRATVDRVSDCQSLVGLPVEVSKTAPPTLLELDEF